MTDTPAAELDAASSREALRQLALAYALGLEAGPEAIDGDGGVRLRGRLRNYAQVALDLARLSAEQVVVAACVHGADDLASTPPLASAPLTGSAPASSAPASAHLEPGAATSFELALQHPDLNRPDTFLTVGLYCRAGFWLEPLGFPAVKLRTAADDKPAPQAPVASRTARPAASTGVTRSDVVQAYRLLLGREPESEAAIAEQLKTQPQLWSLITGLMNSQEGARWRFHEACTHLFHDLPAAEVELEADPGQMTRLAHHVQSLWREFGRAQPYFSALANPDYLAERLNRRSIDAFYATGASERAAFRAACARNDLVPRADGAVLELGARVGRIGEGLARDFSRYVGVDICVDQLAIARARFHQGDLEQAGVQTLDDFLRDETGYDVFFSVLCLQHYPPPLMQAWLGEGLRKLKLGGCAYFQLPCQLHDYRFRLDAFLDGRARSGPLQLHALPQRRVFDLLARHGLTVLEMLPSPRIGPAGMSYAFLARKAA